VTSARWHIFGAALGRYERWRTSENSPSETVQKALVGCKSEPYGSRKRGEKPPLLRSYADQLCDRGATQHLFGRFLYSTLAILGRKRWGTFVTAIRQKRGDPVRTLPATKVQALAPSRHCSQGVSLATCSSARVRYFSAAPGRRIVSSALRTTGMERQKRFHRYHRGLREALAGRAEKRAAPFCGRSLKP
jgi:hypothetical protein